LLSNALKNTQRGTVTLEARRRKDAAGEWVVFRVIDTGTGIAPEQQQKLFNRFETGQAEGGLERGFGLGLSICLLYCQAMGGTIYLERSEPGEGSTFAVRLPAVVRGPAAGPRPRRHDAPPAPTQRDEMETNFVLIIDDDASLRELMERRLSRDGFRTRSAPTGEEGLRLAKQLLPSAIILDVVMPGMDGWDVLAALKTDVETSDIPVIMATMVEDRERGLALGADDYITKPFSRDGMAELIRKHLDGGRAPRILVVEDDPEALLRLGQSLREQRWEVVAAVDGREALERIAERRPDLILLDLMLPQVDGFEVIERIRHDKAWRDIPIIVISGVELDAGARGRLQGKVQQILSKGLLGRDELLRHVRDLIATPPARAAQPTETADAEGALHRG
jgi:CheY-like chemotaxis protein